MHSGVATDDALNLSMSEHAVPLYEAVKAFIANEVEPITEEYYRLGQGRAEHWGYGEGQLELLEGVKSKAKANGLWNFFLPNAETGEGLSNLDYAYIANELGKNPLASESLNCSAPDTGNMEVLERVGTPEQKEQWLKPLLNGEIRSAYVMTEPDVASSDAKQLECFAEEDGDEWLINGEKYYASGAGDPRCKIYIVMLRTSWDGPPHASHTQVLVPADTPGIIKVDAMQVFGEDDAPHGHLHLKFDNVRVPKANTLLGEGKGFEISQVRLGPGRIHHCMRSIGAAEYALELMVKRSLQRTTFGTLVAQKGLVQDWIAESRIEIDMAREYVLRAAYLMDTVGNKAAATEISGIKVAVPRIVCGIIDRAIQTYGAAGVTQYTPLAEMYAGQRTLRIADGPDEVHKMTIARREILRHEPNFKMNGPIGGPTGESEPQPFARP
jgi:acyl-CoA dehydrogenase